MTLRVLIFLIFLTGIKSSFSQTRIPESFADSVVRVIAAVRQPDAIALGDAFRKFYNATNIETGLAVRRQISAMSARRYKARPELQSYIKALLSGVKVMEGMRIMNWLTVTDSVIIYEPSQRAIKYFENSRGFFEQSRLGSSKSFSWYARRDNFEFVFIRSEQELISEQNTAEESPSDSLPVMPSWWMPAYPPSLSGGAIRFGSIDLQIVAPADTLRISEVAGGFSLAEGVFIGTGGSFSWPDLPGVHFRSTDTWFFDTANPRFTIERGRLNYTGVLQSPVQGKLLFNITATGSENPKFISFENTIPLNRVTYPGLGFRGGFSLSGRKSGNESVQGKRAELKLEDDGVTRFYVRAPELEFKDSVASARNSRVSLYYRNDSVFHPSVDFVFNMKNRVVTLSRSRGELKDVPFESSYFNIDFSADRLVWHMERDSMDIFSSSDVAQVPVIIQSKDFFNQNDWRLLGGVGFDFHPMRLVAQYAFETGNDIFYVDDLAKKINKPAAIISSAMTFLASKGMIGFDKATGVVKLEQRGLGFAMASSNDTDFDNLKILASAELVPDISVSLRKGIMQVRGVDEFRISDSLNLKIKPDSAMVIIKKNRDMRISGRITAGNFEIKGKNFDFKYDSFYIVLDKIDSIGFLIEEKDVRGQSYRRRLNNVLVGADSLAEENKRETKMDKATLYINLPQNKSGKIHIPAYPRLDANTGGMFYFDRKEILNGIYGRSVFFLVPPFKLDSLNKAGNVSFSMPGSFFSGNMFPVFKDSLTIMKDKSLGFSHQIPPAGYSLFKGKGVLKGQISLDNRGILGSGVLEYYSAQFRSDDILFLPDSVTFRGRNGLIAASWIDAVSLPQALLPRYKFKWTPLRNQISLINVSEPFYLYDKSVKVKGELTLTEKGMTGAGNLETRGSELSSIEMKFSDKKFTALQADFRIPTEDVSKPALQAKDVRLTYDLEKNFAQINPEYEGDAALDFPYAKIKTSIPDARWDFNSQKIIMTKAPAVAPENSYFYTTREDLDSLSFMATGAEYDIIQKQLLVRGIPYIQVADARITPSGGQVLIMENSKIDQLKNTTIVLNTQNTFHTLKDGVVDIISKNEFKGYGTYQYVNAVRDTFKIRFSDFRMEAAPSGSDQTPVMQTVASGNITEEDNLLLSPRIFYKGRMTMYALRPALELKGYIKLDLKTIRNHNTWITHEQSGDEENILIAFDKAFSETGDKAAAGIHYNNKGDLYVDFLSGIKSENDEDFFLPAGTLFYDTATSEFKIEDLKKSTGEKLSGKVLAYREEKEEIKFEGPVNFFRNNPDFEVRASAIGFGNLISNDVKMNALITIDGAIPLPVMTALSENLTGVIKNENVPEGMGDPTELLYKVANIVGETQARFYEKKSLQSYTSLTTLPEMIKAIVLSSVDMRWSDKYKGFYSIGDIGLSNIGRTDINGSFEGFLEARKNEDGSPVFHLFIKAAPEVWYYFGYEDSRLMIQTSVPEINDQVFRRSNAGKARPGELVLIPGSEEETLEYVNRFRKNYLQIDTPYDLNGRRSSASKKETNKKEEKDDGF
ncbi:MAG: hypothetical protein ACO3FI_04095 [Cyclobacteriaceae bacterium]